MKIGEWCEASKLKATSLAKQLEAIGANVTRQSLSGVISGKKQAPLDVALKINQLSHGLVTLEEMVLVEDYVPEVPEVPEVDVLDVDVLDVDVLDEESKEEDLDDLLAGL